MQKEAPNGCNLCYMVYYTIVNFVFTKNDIFRILFIAFTKSYRQNQARKICAYTSKCRIFTGLAMLRKSIFIIGAGLCLAGQAYAAEHIVEVVTDYDNMRMYFQPKTLIIQPGDTVTWVNKFDEDHNMVTYPDGYPRDAKGFQSPYLSKAGDKWSHTFTVTGTYEYHCIPHVFMGMHGTIVAGRISDPDDYHLPTPEEMIAYRTELLRFFDEEDFEYAPHYVRAKQHTKKAKE